MNPEMSIEEVITLLEDLYEIIPTLIFLVKISNHKSEYTRIQGVNSPVGPHVDGVVESVHAQGHPEIPQNTY